MRAALGKFADVPRGQPPLEAYKALGKESIFGYLVQATKH
jgi:hypothetical protein